MSGERATEVAREIPARLLVDCTKPDARLAIVYKDNAGMFRRVLMADITGADLIALCDAALRGSRADGGRE